jgi:hypothetical protein
MDIIWSHRDQFHNSDTTEIMESATILPVINKSGPVNVHIRFKAAIGLLFTLLNFAFKPRKKRS